MNVVYVLEDTRPGMEPIISIHWTMKGAKEALRKAKEDEPKAKRGAFKVTSRMVQND